MERNPILEIDSLYMPGLEYCPKNVQDNFMDFSERIILWQVAIKELQNMSELVEDMISHLTKEEGDILRISPPLFSK